MSTIIESREQPYVSRMNSSYFKADSFTTSFLCVMQRMMNFSIFGSILVMAVYGSSE